jgi:hypothetical protein
MSNSALVREGQVERTELNVYKPWQFTSLRFQLGPQSAIKIVYAYVVTFKAMALLWGHYQ